MRARRLRLHPTIGPRADSVKRSGYGEVVTSENSVSRTRASLVVLSSTMTGGHIEERLGLAGDRRWDAGEPVSPGSRSHQRFSGWELKSRLDRSAPAASHLGDLLERASRLGDRISGLAAAAQIESSRVWLHLDSPEVSFALEPEMLRAIADLGSLEVDIYG
jgi:hypothetical protein